MPGQPKRQTIFALLILGLSVALTAAMPSMFSREMLDALSQDPGRSLVQSWRPEGRAPVSLPAPGKQELAPPGQSSLPEGRTPVSPAPGKQELAPPGQTSLPEGRTPVSPAPGKQEQVLGPTLHHFPPLAAAPATANASGESAPPTPDPAKELQALRMLETLVLAPPAGSGGADPAARDRIESSYRDLISRHPGFMPARDAFAEFFLATGRPREAEQTLSEALALQPDSAGTHHLLGGIRLERGDIKAAAGHFRQAIETDPVEPLYHYDLANLLFLFRHDLAAPGEAGAAANLALALEHFEKASALAPANLDLATAYAECFYTVDPPQWEKAIAAWNRVLALTSEKDRVRLHLARVYLRMGRKKDALDALAAVVTNDYDRSKNQISRQVEKLPDPSAH